MARRLPLWHPYSAIHDSKVALKALVLGVTEGNQAFNNLLASAPPVTPCQPSNHGCPEMEKTGATMGSSSNLRLAVELVLKFRA